MQIEGRITDWDGQRGLILPDDRDPGWSIAAFTARDVKTGAARLGATCVFTPKRWAGQQLAFRVHVREAA